MATQQAVAATGARASTRRDWHKYRLALGAAAAIILLVAVAAYGYRYYSLDIAHRIASPMHAQLRPSGTIGRMLGIGSGVLFLLLFLYPVRKRWPWLAKKGKTKHWLDFHILLGLTAPALITFHSSFKLHGVAGLAYWIMMSVVVSGIAGRYLYAQIPRRLDAAEMSLQDIQAASSRLAEEIRERHGPEAGAVAFLSDLPAPERVQSLSLWRVLLLMLMIDLRRPLIVWKLRRKFRGNIANRDLREAVSLLNKQAVLSKKVVFLARTQQVFHLWHVIHRPFSYSFVVLSCLHVTIVLLLGY
jgi:hypothetical protein